MDSHRNNPRRISVLKCFDCRLPFVLVAIFLVQSITISFVPTSPAYIFLPVTTAFHPQPTMLKQSFLPHRQVAFKEPLGVTLYTSTGKNLNTYKEDSESNNATLFLSYEHISDNAATAAAAYANSKRPKMIVFDKDGTLGNDSASYQKWVLHFAQKVQEHFFSDNTGVEPSEEDRDQLLADFFEFIGWDSKHNKVVASGPIAAGTWDGCKTMVSDFLVLHGMRNTKEIVQQWHEELGNLLGADAPLVENLQELMLTCQRMGYKIGICTSDERASTDAAMKSWKIESIVDVSICADEVSQCKPSAVPLRDLCQLASSSAQDHHHEYLPQDCIVVGDTTSDTGMASASGVGLCVGVMTGSGTAEQLLETGAHLVVPDVGHLPALLQTLERISRNEHQEPQ